MICSLILGRKGSLGFPGKNLYEINRHPLSWYPMRAAINSQEIGRLYGGDWLLMPLTVVDADDVVVAPSSDDAVVLEYTMFYEEA